MREAPVVGSVIKCCWDLLLRPGSVPVIGLINAIAKRSAALLSRAIEVPDRLDCIWRG